MRWRPTASAQRDEGGFTLVELLVAIGLFAFVTALAVPSIRGSAGGLTVRVAAHKLAAEMRAARAAAQRTNLERQVEIDVARYQYRADGGTGTHRLPSTLSVTVVVPDGERQGSAGRFRFFPDGSSTGGRIMLSDARRKAELAVDWLSGDVRVRWN
jgi:general secretion pathway protein H